MNQNIILMNPAEPSPFLSAVYAWGIAVIRNIQIIVNPVLTVFMKFISSFGNEFFYIVIVLLIFWCIDEKKGFRLGLLVIISAWINMVLKTVFGQPRPFDFDPSLGLSFEPSNGFPSGHAQMSMTFWITVSYLFAKNKIKTFLWVFSFAMILLIGFSRLYLGVHFPTDVFAGWIFACVVMGLFYILEKPITPVLNKAGIRPQLIIAAAAALIMNALYLRDTSLSAMLLGFCAGYSFMTKHFPFTARNDQEKHPGFHILALRSVAGLIGFVVIYIGLRSILPGKDSFFSGVAFLAPYYELSRFVRYTLLGLWASAGAPGVFQNIKLAVSRKEK